MVEFPRKADGRRVFSVAFKQETVARITSGEKTLAELSRELGISPSVVRNWMRLVERGGTTAVAAGEDVVPASRVRELDSRMDRRLQQDRSPLFPRNAFPKGVSCPQPSDFMCLEIGGAEHRGVFAEHLVALALKVPVTGIRDEWSPCDLTTPEGITVQVKSAAFIQSWFQRQFSRVTFSIKLTRAWDPETNIIAPELARHAQVYVFALLAHTDKPSIDPLKLEQWRFFAVATRKLEECYAECTAISLASLKELAGDGRRFEDLRPDVLAAAASC